MSYKEKNKKYSVLPLQIFIFALLFCAFSMSYKHNSIYLLSDMQNYAYYCLDKTAYKLTTGKDDYIFVRGNVDIEEVRKNME